MSDTAERTQSSPRAWRHVLEHVEARLIAGELVPGDRLPGERVLSADLGVGRSSVREALRVLEALGLVRTATGSGPSSGATIIATPGGAMSTLMRLQVAAHGFPVEDVVRTRLLLEGAVVADLAASPADLTRAIALVDAMDVDTLAPEEFLALDASFHLALAEAAGNQVVAATMTGLRGGIEAYVLDGQVHLRDWGTTRGRLRDEHRAVLAAIAAGDARAARAGIQAHISGYYAEISLDS